MFIRVITYYIVTLRCEFASNDYLTMIMFVTIMTQNDFNLCLAQDEVIIN